ncbi:glycosyltransferase family 4 protein [Bacillus sp. V3B]|uniref:glycosyltransferase family 4 protein n=1 Tax=Bacillus sp. V3B TaxID=2804915 RepID=UPI00210D5A6A|nr:glycosyltransferase family 4 protein [Bacillus sp. V3B]MCQ6275575.1 glycosyltransferase family 4 protein [Bacillus sp. V3B]
MKILMICTEKLPVPPVLGGAIQTYISGILPYVGNKHDITVLGVNDPSLPDTETIDGVHYARIPGKVFEIYREEVVRYLQSNHFDLIHIFNRPRLVLSVRKAAPQSKINLSMHNDMFMPEKIEAEEARAVIEEVTNIVTISEYVGNVIKDLYPQAASKLRAIYSGVDSERFLPGSDPKMQKIRNEIKKTHGLENKTVLLFAGRVSRNKGVDRLVRALPGLSRKFKDLALVIVGGKWFSQDDITDYIAYVRALAKKSPIPVVTTGFVSPDEIQNWFAAADLFVCTSLWQEPVARVHYEAMAAGLPIVTTARGGNPEVILLGENGLIVENPEDPTGFEEKITEILSNKALMNKMRKKGREQAVSIYKWERVASEVLEVWEQSIQTSIQMVPQEEVGEIVEQFDRDEPLNKLESGTENKLENETKDDKEEEIEE